MTPIERYEQQWIAELHSRGVLVNEGTPAALHRAAVKGGYRLGRMLTVDAALKRSAAAFSKARAKGRVRYVGEVTS